MKSSLQPGMTLQGRYKILERIGSGGMGHVFRAEALRLNKDCALKEMQDHFIDPEERAKIAAQFMNEAQTLAKLDHPGIPHILDTFEENEKHYLVMEYVEGQTLEDVVMNSPDYLSQNQVLGWVWQIIDVLEYLHTLPEPVILRDLKPANIMVTDEGRIKIIDFGIAKIFEHSASQTKTRMKGSGSAGFAPPEQYGSAGTDNRSDIYSLGVTIYYLLTRLILPDSVDRILNGGAMDAMSKFNPTVTEPLDKMIEKMVQLKPEERFQGVDKLRLYLSEHSLKGEFMPVTVKRIQTIIPPKAELEEKANEVNKWKAEYETANSPALKKLTLEDVYKGSKKPGAEEEKTIPIAAPDPLPPTSGLAGAIQKNAATRQGSGEEPAQANISSQRPRYMSEAMISKPPPMETAKPSESSPWLTVLVALTILIFLGGGGFFIFKYAAGPQKPQPVPSPTETQQTPAPSPTETPKPYTEKIIEGEISTIEIGKDDVKIRIQTESGFTSLVVAKKELPAKVKAGAQVQASYKVPKNSSQANPPWRILNMTVLTEAPDTVAPPPIHKTPQPVKTKAPQPAYTPRYTPAQPAYTPKYTPPPAQPSRPKPPPSSGGSSGGSTSSGGSFTQPKTNY